MVTPGMRAARPARLATVIFLLIFGSAQAAVTARVAFDADALATAGLDGAAVRDAIVMASDIAAVDEAGFAFYAEGGQLLGQLYAVENFAGLGPALAGVEAELVGVGTGRASTVRRVLGIGGPQATALADARAARMRHLDETGVYCHVIADGGSITRDKPKSRIRTREQLEKERQERGKPAAPGAGLLGEALPEPGGA